jgi:hypothetical protein
MLSFTSRALPLLAFALLLAACQNRALQAPLPATDELVSAFRQLELSLDAGRLEEAQQRLGELQQRASGDTRLEQYRRQLAEAYMQQGQQALQKGDLDTATSALGSARALLPQAPALTTGLDDAIADAREESLRAAEQARAEAAAREEQARQLRLAAERQAAIQPAQPSSLPVERASAPAAPRARLIDPSAAASAVPLPMLDYQDNEGLRNLLDSVAADVVGFDCAVRIEVREAKDFQWVAALLSARVKKLDSGFSLSLNQTLKPEQEPRLLLSPRR